ncbi:MAG TPA: ABC transporter permease [Acidimicrobiales bacterium]|nr:ABC transporter permease [Acidimicrobiales bacterium]
MAAPALVRVVEREARVFRQLWRGSVFSSVVTPLLFLAAMGIGLGDLVDERSGSVDGFDYLVFVTPGLLAASAMQTAAGESLWPVMAGTKWMRFFHAMVATPVAPGDVYGGFVVWQALRVVLASTLFLAVAALLGGVVSWWGVLAIPAVTLCAAAFAAPLAAFAVGRESDQSFALIMRLAIVPLFLFSGTFFPVDQLPDALEPVAWLSPLWHGVELARSATTGSADLGPTVAHVVVLAAVIAVSWRLGTRAFARRLTA